MPTKSRTATKSRTKSRTATKSKSKPTKLAKAKAFLKRNKVAVGAASAATVLAIAAGLGHTYHEPTRTKMNNFGTDVKTRASSTGNYIASFWPWGKAEKK